MTARRSLSFSIAGLLCVCVFVPFSVAEDFRVETDVFLDKKPQPVAETLTLFKKGVVYDFVMTEPREATVFDVQRGRIVLLSPETETQAEITTQELVQFTAAIRQVAQSREGNTLFGTEFAAKFDEENKEVHLQGKSLGYQAKGLTPKTEAAVADYQEFADWYARLNATRAGNPPPFARLELNRQLAQNGLLPNEIHRTLNLPGKLMNKKQQVTSKHAFTWLLSGTDNTRIADAGTWMAKFKKVSLTEFWNLKDNLAANDR